MAKSIKINVSLEVEPELLALSSPEPGYKLAWNLNRYLNITLSRQEDKAVHLLTGQEDPVLFEHYAWQNIPGDESFRLVANRESGHLLIPEFRNIDWWLLAENLSEVPDMPALQQQLKQIGSIRAVFHIAKTQIKNLQNLYFEKDPL